MNINIDLEERINQYLAQVAEQNVFALPEAVFRASMARLTVRLLTSLVSDIDDCLKQLEKNFDTLIGKESPVNDETNRNFEIAQHPNYEALFQIDDKIAEITARIRKLEVRKAKFQANGTAKSELASIDKDLQYETKHLASLNADRRAMLGYLG